MLLELAGKIKAVGGPYARTLAGKSVILIFEKASLRTKVTFEVGIQNLGGAAIYMDQSGSKLGEREHRGRLGKNLERWVQCIVARVLSQKALEELACEGAGDQRAVGPVPSVPGARGRVRAPEAGAAGGEAAGVRGGREQRVPLADARCDAAGMEMTVVCPKGYEPSAEVTAECERFAAASGGKLTISSGLRAITGASRAAPDVWVSMGQAEQAQERRRAFADYQGERGADAAGGAGVARGAAVHALPAGEARS